MPSSTGSIVRLDNVTFFEGDALTFVNGGSVSFSPSSGAITTVSAEKPTPSSDSQNITVIDCSGYLLLPGLIDVGAVQGCDSIKSRYVSVESAYESMHAALKAGTTTAVLAGTEPLLPVATTPLPTLLRFLPTPTGFAPSPNPHNLHLQLSKSSGLGFVLTPGGLEGSGLVALTNPPTPWRCAEGMTRVLAASGLEGGEGVKGILRALTGGAAEALGLENTGRVEVGCKADLVLVKMETAWTMSAEGILLPLFLSGALNASRVHAVFIGGALKHLIPSTSISGSLSTLTLNTYYLGPNAPMTNGTASGFDTIESALEALRNGEFIIAVDNEDRENEGDLIIAGEFATDEKMAFMIRYSSGLICVAMPGDRLDKLELPLMVANNQDSYRTAYTISVDLATGTSTGISSGDRARTIAALANPSSVAADFNRPGHVFPLRAREGGVLTRVGHTEASVDLCRLAGLNGVAAICEVVKDEGGMARRDELRGMARRWGVKMVTIADLVKYRIENGFGEGW